MNTDGERIPRLQRSLDVSCSLTWADGPGYYIFAPLALRVGAPGRYHHPTRAARAGTPRLPPVLISITRRYEKLRCLIYNPGNEEIHCETEGGQ
jgi:hypothetical protein